MKRSRFILMLVTLALAALACSLPTAAPSVVVVETVIVTIVADAPIPPTEPAALPSATDLPAQPPAAVNSPTPWPTNTPGPTNTPAPSHTSSASPTIIRTPTRTPTYSPERYWQFGSPTPFVACPGALPSRLWAGGYAYVLPEPPIANIVRSGAGTSYREIGYIDPGWGMEILEGPTCADGLVWWKVRTFADDLTGWTAEQDGKYYWLAPCPLDTECGVMDAP